MRNLWKRFRRFWHCLLRLHQAEDVWFDYDVQYDGFYFKAGYHCVCGTCKKE